MPLTLPVGHAERFHIGLKDSRGLLVPVGEGESITVMSPDKRVAIELDALPLQDPNASALQIAASGLVRVTNEPFVQPEPEKEEEEVVNTKPWAEWTPEEKEDHARKARALEDKKFPNRFPAPQFVPVVITATYKGPNGESSVTDTVTVGLRKAGKLFGGGLVIPIPPAPPAAEPTAPPTEKTPEPSAEVEPGPESE